MVESHASQVRVRQAKRHARIIGPLTWLEPERPAADHVIDVCFIARQELQGGAYGIANGQTQQRTFGSVERLFGVNVQTRDSCHCGCT